MSNSKMLTMLVILAVALTAGAATAGDMNWSFFGKAHSSINMLSNGENSQLGLTSNTSRFGFKGHTPMNDDVHFIWAYERGLNIAQKNTTLSARNTYVGFKGNFGQIRMGIHDTPHKTLGRKTTFFYDTIGDNRQMTFGTDTREGDILAWISPDWDGFGVFLAYQFDQDSGKLNPSAPADAEFMAETVFSGMASYKADEFFVGASTIMFSEGYADMDLAGETGDSPMVFRFAGKYYAEKFALAASFLNVSSQMFDGTDFVDMTASTMGFEGMFNATEDYVVKAAYYMADPNTDVDDDDYSLMVFGVDRNYGKALTLYVQYASLSYGDAAGNWPLGDVAFGADVPGWNNGTGFENPYGLSVGAYYKW